MITLLLEGGEVPNDKRLCLLAASTRNELINRFRYYRFCGQYFKVEVAKPTFNGWVKATYLGKICRWCDGEGEDCNRCNERGYFPDKKEE